MYKVGGQSGGRKCQKRPFKGKKMYKVGVCSLKNDQILDNQSGQPIAIQCHFGQKPNVAVLNNQFAAPPHFLHPKHAALMPV